MTCYIDQKGKSFYAVRPTLKRYKKVNSKNAITVKEESAENRNLRVELSEYEKAAKEEIENRQNLADL